MEGPSYFLLDFGQLGCQTHYSLPSYFALLSVEACHGLLCTFLSPCTFHVLCQCIALHLFFLESSFIWHKINPYQWSVWSLFSSYGNCHSLLRQFTHHKLNKLNSKYKLLKSLLLYQVGVIGIKKIATGTTQFDNMLDWNCPRYGQI